MPPLLRVVGYAIVSADGMIADAAGAMPASIMHEADQRFFAQGLDQADVVVHGRHSHEQQANSPRRQRLVVTRRIATLAPHPDNPKAQLWNPSGATLEQACEALGVTQGEVAIIGGTEVFGLFLPRYDTFHLTRAERARIAGGRPVFPGIPPHTPEELLQNNGLRPSATRVLDADAGVSVVTWQR
jgi:dihydrofolate reductase